MIRTLFLDLHIQDIKLVQSNPALPCSAESPDLEEEVVKIGWSAQKKKNKNR